ncbi:MAG: hypothetical protein WCH34_13405 [Bacteroidota bacterium]
MKKLVISMFIVLCAVTFVNAQDFKPSSGLTMEVNFLPANTTTPISINELKGRYFFNERMALRLGLLINMANHTWDNQYGVGGTAPIVVEEYKNKYFVFGITPGFELHVGDMERFSPYFGAELGLRFASSSASITNYGGTSGDKIELSGANIASIAGTTINYNNIGATTISFNLLTGFDFYISKHLYMGAEIGLGFSSISNKDIELTRTIAGVSTTVTDPLGDKFTNLGVVFNPAIRLGWAF